MARAVIFTLGMAIASFGAWGLAIGKQRPVQVGGFGTALVLGALLVVFAALLPWLADGPVRFGPLTLTLRIRARRRAVRRRRSNRSAG